MALYLFNNRYAIRNKPINIIPSVLAKGIKEMMIPDKINLFFTKRYIERINIKLKNISVNPENIRTVYMGENNRKMITK